MADPVDRRKQALGRGLDALFGPPGEDSGKGAGGRGLLQVAVDRLRPMASGQPRERFEGEALEELAASVKEHGVLQPLLVRPVPGGFEIVAGERRWRAAQRAGLLEVPVIVREKVSAEEAFELALVENLQREDLNPIEAARGYRRLADEFGYTQERLARRVGKDRSTITNALRLLKLPESVQDMVSDGRLTEGHARALLAIEDAARLLAAAHQVQRRGLSVRQTEALARAGRAGAPADAKGRSAVPPAQRDLIERLQRSLGARVVLHERKGAGRLEIHFTSLDQLDALLDKLL